MLFVPTAQIMAANAQQRHYAGVRYDTAVSHRSVERIADTAGRSPPSSRAASPADADWLLFAPHEDQPSS